VIEGNLGIWTRTSDALLETDTTPATFWITHPNNTVVRNRAAGSEGYGFWYRLLDNPDGQWGKLDDGWAAACNHLCNVISLMSLPQGKQVKQGIPVRSPCYTENGG
jgi:hypothetical protein